MTHKCKYMRKLLDFIFGRKYYVIIVGERGSDRYDMASQIHTSKESAHQHRLRIESTRTYMYITTVSFRSHHQF